MNQIARGGDDPAPPEGGTTRVPQTAQSKGPPADRTSKEIRTADTIIEEDLTQVVAHVAGNAGPAPAYAHRTRVVSRW